MQETWRLFEQLVASLEENLGPKGVQVKSPDHIRDKITGELREVDASIRYKFGSAFILITVECRDRLSAQDITWLEQIKSKKDSIGANQTIVVSRQGFTRPAVLYARRHGIELRMFSSVKDELITSSFYLNNRLLPTREFLYSDVDGKSLGRVSIGLAESGGSVRLLIGEPRRKEK